MMIEIKHLKKVYNDNKVAVKDLSLTVEDGELFAFIGHNGAGKTTTIKAMVGIIDFDEGDILINGHSIVSDTLNAKKEMAYLPDNPDLYENMTAIKYLNFICDMYQLDLEKRQKNIEKYAKMFGMDLELNNPIASFSHGMKQKIALIAALVHEPKVLVMDEPFVGLDPKAVYEMKGLMKQMCQEGKIIFFSTHILDVAEKLCDRVAIIKNGSLIVVGDMESVKGNTSLESVFLDLEA